MSNFLENIWSSMVEQWLLYATIVTCMVMAIFRTKKKEGKADFIEASMCGLFAYGIWFVLGFFNIPEGGGVLVGGIVGYLGTHTISAWITDKLGIESKKDEDEE